MLLNIKSINKFEKMDLPDEIYRMIFEFLSYDDLVIVKEVNKRFNYLILELIKSKFILIKDDKEEIPMVYKLFDLQNYGHSDSSYDSGDFLNAKDCLIGRSMINLNLNTDLHGKLSKLIIFNSLKLSDLSKFANLIHLELNSDIKTAKLNKLILKLDQLKILNFNDRPTYRTTIILDTPKLKALKVNTPLSNLKIMYPSSIEILICLSNILIDQFVNLKVLECSCVYLNDNSVKKLKNLETFSFNEYRGDVLISTFLDHFIDNNVAIFYKNIGYDANPFEIDGLSIVSSVKLNDFSLEIYERCIDFLGGSLPQIELEISNLGARSLPIIKRLINLKSLIITDAFEDKTRWIQILKAPMLNELKIKCHINQSMLDEIPKYCKVLTSLEIHNFDNLNFILNLKYLKIFKPKQFFDFNLLSCILCKLANLKLISINFFNLEIANNRISCKFDNEIERFSTIDEPKNVFVQMARLINNWEALFALSNRSKSN